MTKEEAMAIVSKKHPNRKIGAVGDEGAHFIVEATDPNNEEENDPFFAVDKNSGEITYYFPEDLIEFGEMMGYGKDDDEDDENSDNDFLRDPEILKNINAGRECLAKLNIG